MRSVGTGELPGDFSDGQKWLYKLMREQYDSEGPNYAFPANEVSGLMEYGVSGPNDDHAFWRAAVRGVPALPDEQDAPSKAAEDFFARLGLVPFHAGDDSPYEQAS